MQGVQELEGEKKVSEIKTTIRGLVPGDKVMLRLPDVKGLTDAERTNRILTEAIVVAIYPHCIQFQTAFGYMTTPCFATAEEMMTGVEHHGRCPWTETMSYQGYKPPKFKWKK